MSIRVRKDPFVWAVRTAVKEFNAKYEKKCHVHIHAIDPRPPRYAYRLVRLYVRRPEGKEMWQLQLRATQDGPRAKAEMEGALKKVLRSKRVSSRAGMIHKADSIPPL